MLLLTRCVALQLQLAYTCYTSLRNVGRGFMIVYTMLLNQGLFELGWSQSAYHAIVCRFTSKERQFHAPT